MEMLVNQGKSISQTLGRTNIKKKKIKAFLGNGICCHNDEKKIPSSIFRKFH
jgi:hypothetical protein